MNYIVSEPLESILSFSLIYLGLHLKKGGEEKDTLPFCIECLKRSFFKKTLREGEKMRKLTVLLLVSLLSIGLMSGIHVQAQNPIELRLGHLSAVGGFEDLVANKIAEEVMKNSEGRLVVNVYPAAQLGSAVSQMESIMIGTQDIFWGALGWLGNFEKDYQILLMPYAFRNQEHQLNFIDSPLALEMEKRLEDQGLLLLSKNAHGLPKVTVSTKPIFHTDDLRGIKMRVPEWPISMKAWEALGTDITVVTWGELYLALAQGVADAMECGFEFVYPAKFHEVAKYITMTEHCYELRGAIAGKRSFERLPEDLQEVLQDALLVGEELYNDLLDHAKVDHTQRILESGAAIIYIDTEPLKEMLLPLVTTMEREGFWREGLFDEVQLITGPRPEPH